ncbi:MAG: DNA polymerase III subunit delta' [Rhodoferax sp.]
MSAAVPPAPWLQAALQRVLGRQGHAWLLHGPSGLGQFDLALAVARAFLCEQPGAQGVACGCCVSCHAIDVHTHADLCVLMPEVQALALGWPLQESVQADLDAKKRKPSKEIRVEALRAAIEFAQSTSARGRGKVILLYPAERMNAISANALLKTLEEPPGAVRFVLASEAAHVLPATIRSRCQALRMPWPDAAAAHAWLVHQGLDPALAHSALRAAGGRAHEALVLAPLADQWARLPRAVQQADAQAFKDWSAAQVLDLLQKLCHDLMLRCAGAPPRFFDAADLPAPTPSWSALDRWVQALMQARRTVEHPYNPGLQLEALLAQAAALWRSD